MLIISTDHAVTTRLNSNITGSPVEGGYVKRLSMFVEGGQRDAPSRANLVCMATHGGSLAGLQDLAITATFKTR
eukprot:6773439-Pyramimonas_sp.AAC.1